MSRHGWPLGAEFRKAQLLFVGRRSAADAEDGGQRALQGPIEVGPLGSERSRRRGLRETGPRLAAWLEALRRRRVWLAVATILGLVLLPPVALVFHVYVDCSGLPDLGPFIRFETPRIGEVYDARGNVLIELAREYRRTVSYDQVPKVLRDAILAAEDKNFLSHSGVDYSVLPRVVQKTAASSLGAWWKGGPGTSGCAFPTVARPSPSSSCAATSSGT